MPKEFQSKTGEEDVDLFVRPDQSQMIPFKPRRMPAPGSHPISGGEFPMPQGKFNPQKLNFKQLTPKSWPSKLKMRF